MAKKMTQFDILKKLVDLDVALNEQRYNRTMTEEEMRKLRRKRDRLDAMLYRR